MLITWSAECGAEDPVLVVPWHDLDDAGNPNAAQFIDLRENPYDLDHIPEAEQYPPLMQALRALNAPRSPLFTAKCDAWTMDAEELAAAQFELGFPAFVSFHHQEQRLHRLVRLLDPLDHPYAMIDAILRPALVDLTGPQEGFAASLYVKALGTDAAHAYEHWTAALEALVTVLRGRELSLT